MHRIYLKTVDYNDVISYTNKEHHPPRDRERESRTLSRLVVSLSLLKVRAPRYEFHIWVKDGPKQNGGFFSVANIQTYTQDLDLLCVLALIPTSCFNCIRAVVIIFFPSLICFTLFQSNKIRSVARLFLLKFRFGFVDVIAFQTVDSPSPSICIRSKDVMQHISRHNKKVVWRQCAR